MKKNQFNLIDKVVLEGNPHGDSWFVWEYKGELYCFGGDKTEGRLIDIAKQQIKSGKSCFPIYSQTFQDGNLCYKTENSSNILTSPKFISKV